MTIAELKEYLNQFDDDTTVVMSKDAEGNDFSPLYDGDHGWYVAESTWSGQFYDLSSYEGDEVDYGVKAVCLWPVN